MPQEIAIRLADAGDAGVLADHRVAMFRDMGAVSPTAEAELRAASAEYLGGHSLGRVRRLGGIAGGEPALGWDSG